MSHYRLITHFQQNNIDLKGFDHFDYVEAIQELNDLEGQQHPKKKRLAQEFAAKCIAKMEEEITTESKIQKCKNFVERMKVYESIRQEKIEALRFIQEKYDSKSGQLRYYPKINPRFASQKGRFWKDKDGLQAIQHESSINTPHSSIFGYSNPDK